MMPVPWAHCLSRRKALSEPAACCGGWAAAAAAGEREGGREGVGGVGDGKGRANSRACETKIGPAYWLGRSAW